MAKPKKTPMYLLAAVYPVTSVNVGLFSDPDEAVQFALANPLTNLTHMPWPDVVDARIAHEYSNFENLDRDENNRPCGYVLQRFDANGEPSGYAEIPPFTNHDPVMPGTIAPPPPKFDASDLDWECEKTD